MQDGNRWHRSATAAARTCGFQDRSGILEVDHWPFHSAQAAACRRFQK